MTREDLQALAAYVRAIADLLELRDWTILLRAAPIGDDDEAEARVNLVYGRKLASLEFSPGFRELEPERQRHVVCHELIHLHVNPVWELLGEGPTEVILGKPAFEVLARTAATRVELAVDGLAEAFANKVSPPDWSYRPAWIADNDRGGDLRLCPFRPDPPDVQAARDAALSAEQRGELEQ